MDGHNEVSPRALSYVDLASSPNTEPSATPPRPTTPTAIPAIRCPPIPVLGGGGGGSASRLPKSSTSASRMGTVTRVPSPLTVTVDRKGFFPGAEASTVISPGSTRMGLLYCPSSTGAPSRVTERPLGRSAATSMTMRGTFGSSAAARWRATFSLSL